MEDPTRPLQRAIAGSVTASQTQFQLPTLTSVLIGDDRRIAVINGHVLTEGMTRFGLTLVQINPSSAVVQLNGGAPITLHMGASNVRKELK